ncbi:MAG: hypothetical protein KF747_11480 [Nitrospira sp.]|nr:hypothetical protein [Nitrospira sp.]
MEPMKRKNFVLSVTTGAVGLALISLAACNSGETTTATPAPGGSVGNANALVFVNNTGDKTLSSVALKGDSGNVVVNTIDAAEFENVTLGDMQSTDGDWVFVNLGAANKVATIDPLTAATPVHEVNLQVGTNPVHLFRSRNDGEVVWIMNDGDNATGTTTPGDDLVNCATQGGGSVTVIHNSHLGPGAIPPRVLGTTCILADGHKVAAFSTSPKRVFVSSTTAGEIAVLDDDETSGTYRQMIGRVDLCNSTKETCDNESTKSLTTAFTPNSSEPHGIRSSKLTNKIYSFQEGYKEIAEIDPATLQITNKFDLAGTPYTGYGISPDGRFLLLRGDTIPPTGTKLGVIDLGTAGTPRTDFTIPELDGTSTGAFKFSPDVRRFYILAGNAVTSTKKDRLFAFDASRLTATPPVLTLIREIGLIAGGDSVGFAGAHSIDVLAEGAGEAKYIAVSNRADKSVSIISAADNLIKQTLTVGTNPGAVLVYKSGGTETGNQASN